MPAIETHALAKDYKVGFWRPRPYRALDGLTLTVEPGRGLRLPGPERGRQDDHPEAADAARLPDVRDGVDPRPAARRPRDEAADRLPAREPVLLRLPDGRGAADLLRRPVRLQGAGPGEAGGAAARRGRPRRRAAPAAAQVLEGDDPARRPGPDADQRPRSRLPRRADVGPRPARPPRRPRPDPAAARRRPHRVLQLAHPVGRRDALQPHRHRGEGQADGLGHARRSRDGAAQGLGDHPRRLAAGRRPPRIRRARRHRHRRRPLRRRRAAGRGSAAAGARARPPRAAASSRSPRCTTRSRICSCARSIRRPARIASPCRRRRRRGRRDERRSRCPPCCASPPTSSRSRCATRSSTASCCSRSSSSRRRSSSASSPPGRR